MRVKHDDAHSGPQHWQRVPQEEINPVKIGSKVPGSGVVPVPNSRGVELVWSIRGVPDTGVEDKVVLSDEVEATVVRKSSDESGVSDSRHDSDDVVEHDQPAHPTVRLIAVVVLSAGAMQNIGERKRATEAMKWTERLVSIGTLAAGVAHELNNPVGAMVLTAEAALSDLQESDSQQVAEASVRRLFSQARRCTDIVNRWLQFTDQRSAPKSIQDLRTIVDGAVDLVHHNAGQSTIVCEIRQEDGCYDVLANPTELAQVCVNLFLNAIQASEAGATVTISLATSRKELSVAVEDRGCGIAHSEPEKVFDPFYTTRLHGHAVGLGLSIAHGIIADHGGTMHVSSQPGEGTRVTVRMPPAGVAQGTKNSRSMNKGRLTRVD